MDGSLDGTVSTKGPSEQQDDVEPVSRRQLPDDLQKYFASIRTDWIRPLNK